MVTFAGADVARITKAAETALTTCARAELEAEQSASRGADVAALLTLLHRCGLALERWCSTTSAAVRTFAATEAGIAMAATMHGDAHGVTRVLERPVTRAAPYLDDAGHTARRLGVVAGIAEGLPPAAAAALTTLPGRLAHGVARLLPEGPGRATPVGSLLLSSSDTGSVGGWLETVDALPDATIGITAVGDGYVVSLPGLHDLGDGPDPMDLYGAVRGLFGRTGAYPGAVRNALDLACVPIGASVLLVGHSQGGITAMDLASDPTFNGRRVAVTHVVTAGSPVSGMRPVSDQGTQVLELDNDDDLVPQLDLRDSRRGTGDGRVVVVFRHDDGTVGGNHGLATAYVPFVDGPAFTTIPGVRAWLRGAARYLPGADAVQQRFALHDR